MREYHQTPSELLTPREKPLPERFYKLMAEINRRQKDRTLTIEDSKVLPTEAAKDRQLVRQKKRQYEGDKTEYANFFEVALPEVNNADWFGENVVVVNQGHGDAADYNDIRGTDLMLEMETKPGEQPIALRVDLTKSTDEAIIEEKVETELLDTQYGRYHPTYFRSYYQETPTQKIDTAPRVVMHLTEEQIDELGNLLHEVNFGEDKKTAVQKLETSSLQISLIEQSRSQLESQALYALALFLEAVHHNAHRYHLNLDRKSELIDFYDRTKTAYQNRDNTEEILGLIEEFLNNPGLEKLPRHWQTTKILLGLNVWLKHFHQLAKEKSDLLSDDVKHKAASDAEFSESHRVLIDRPSRIGQTMPERLAFAA